MGDLKKKKVDYICKTDDGQEIFIEQGEMATDEQTIETLRAYMKKFYEMQMEKEEKKDEEQLWLDIAHIKMV